ncbi:2-keto-4-pentenoate hydratase [Luteimonas huabeiensis]|uniref:2-keto-4-pentenoate hydratase n=1 Tax=Luteimonas huabeiensis TaxID=1244513 RepID=UPI0004B7EF65|nr:2-keto-4-pentenoate hydratase [Luteimonas huabeiensis]
MSQYDQTPAAAAGHAQDAAAIAERFVAARAAAQALAGFPGAIPPSLEAAYRVQDLAIARWADEIAGWKVGYIQPQRRDASGDDRLLGPIWRRHLWPAQGEVEIPVFEGGFAAVEAEYVLRLEADADPERMQWTPEEAARLPATLWVGIEVASSPLATINALGPCVVVSDFGNNNGLVLGPEVADWAGRDEAGLVAETWIDGRLVGRGGATLLPGGLRAAFAFALARSARRGRALRQGDLVATGNATGIHDILPGQRARVDFAGIATLDARAVAAAPEPEARR